ncbi:MAG TPA: ATP-binding protein, partial [Clostridium sp.]|nr:ATP-binding protein [Clostridium sp.]
ENGEYHTFVYDGPLFKEPVNFKFDEIVRNGNYSVLPLSLE